MSFRKFATATTLALTLLASACAPVFSDGSYAGLTQVRFAADSPSHATPVEAMLVHAPAHR